MTHTTLTLKENGRLVFEQRPRPALRPDEVLIDVCAAGICNSDIGRGFQHKAYHTPLVMGHEFSGTITELGSDVSRWACGDRVVVFPLLPCFRCDACHNAQWVHCRHYSYYGSRCDGGFSERIAVNHWNLVRVPDAVSLKLAALTEPVAVCIHTLNTIPRSATGSVAILGAGFMGLVMAHLLAGRGSFETITLLDRNPSKCRLAVSHGFTAQLLPSGRSTENASGAASDLSDDDAALLAEVSNLDRSFDYVIEACGAVSTFRQSLALARSGGQVIWMGNIQGDLLLSESVVSSILRKELTIKGVWNSEFQPTISSDWTAALLAIGTLNWLEDVVTFAPFETAPDVFDALYRHRMEPKSDHLEKGLSSASEEKNAHSGKAHIKTVLTM